MTAISITAAKLVVRMKTDWTECRDKMTELCCKYEILAYWRKKLQGVFLLEQPVGGYD